MSDKARTERGKRELDYAPINNTQKEKKQAEQSQEARDQRSLQETSDQAQVVKWPLLIGSGILLVALLGIGYFYGSGAIDEFSSVTLAIAVTLVVTLLTAALWWLNRSR